MSTRPPLLTSLVPLLDGNVEIEASGNAFVVKHRRLMHEARVNHSMAYFLSQCTGARTFGQIIADLSEKLDVAEGKVYGDISGNLTLLVYKGFITYAGTPCFGDAPPGPHYAPGTFHNNRGVIVDKVLKARGYRPATSDEIAEVAMFSYRSSQVRYGKFRSFGAGITLNLRDKRRLCRNLRKYGLEHLAPVGYVSLEEFNNRRCSKADRNWFVKLSNSTEAKGIYLETGDVAVNRRVESFGQESFVIQEDFTDLHLLDGHKYNTRVYVLALSGPRFYVYNQYLCFRYPEKFDVNNPTRLSHICGNASEGAANLPIHSATLEHFPLLNPILHEHLSQLFHGMAHIFQRNNLPYRYQIFGLDYLFSSSLDPVLIEVNDWPNIGDFKRYEEWLRQFRYEMIDEMYDIVLSEDSEPKLNHFKAL